MAPRTGAETSWQPQEVVGVHLGVPIPIKENAVKILTLIAVAIIDRTNALTLAQVAKRGNRVRADVAGLANVLMVIGDDGCVLDAGMVKANRAKDGGFAFTLDTVAKAPAVIGLDFSDIIATGPNPVRLLELDVDGRNKLVAADVLSAETIKAAKGSIEPTVTVDAAAKTSTPATKKTTATEPKAAAVHTCKAKNFFGEQCQVKVAKRGETCVWHSGTKCGAEATGTTRPCQMTVATEGDHCVYHGGPAKKSRRKAA
jgi:hypothetical protein